LLRKVNVLFLCTGAGRVNPYAIELLEKNRLPTAGLRSKNWDEFARGGAPKLDLVFTVCDNAAGETCPVWPGQPITAHWGVADPAAVQGTDAEKRKAFLRAFTELSARINLLLALPVDKLDRLVLQKKLDDIGRA
jgi:arsenate reductase